MAKKRKYTFRERLILALGGALKRKRKVKPDPVSTRQSHRDPDTNALASYDINDLM